MSIPPALGRGEGEGMTPALGGGEGEGQLTLKFSASQPSSVYELQLQ